MNEVTSADRELFAEFARRIEAALKDRIEGDVAAGELSDFAFGAEELASLAQEGAALLPARWPSENGDITGVVLWTGALSALLGDDPRAAADLTAEDLDALGQSLTLNLGEGGEGKLGLTWSGVELVSAANVSDRVAELGLGTEAMGVAVPIAFGGHEMTFHFLPGPPAPAEEAPEADFAVDEMSEDPASHEAPAATAPAAAAPVEDEDDETPLSAIPDHLLDVNIPLSIRLGSTYMNLDDVLRLAPGAVVELDQREDEPLEVVANGRVIAHGEVVVVDERFGIKITDIGTSADRLRSV